MKKRNNKRKKTLILVITALCVIALIAEGILLIHAFGKKKKPAGGTAGEPTEQEAKHDTPTSAVTLSVTPTEEPREEYKTVYRVTKISGVYENGQEGVLTAYEYDELGRVTKRTEYANGRVAETETTVYDRFGSLSEIRDMDNDLVEIRLTDPTGERYSVRTMMGESYDFTYDENGNRTGFHYVIPYSDGEKAEYMTVWKYDENGRVSERSEYYSWNGSSGELSSKTTYRRDALGRVIGYSESDGTGELLNDVTITYDGEKHTIETQAYIGFTRYFYSEYDEDGFAVNDLVRMADATSQETKLYYPKGIFPEGMKTALTAADVCSFDENGTKTEDSRTEFRSDGQPLYGMDLYETPRRSSEYEYDADGNLIGFLMFNYQGEIYVDNSYQLDGNGCVIEWTDTLHGVHQMYEWTEMEIPVGDGT